MIWKTKTHQFTATVCQHTGKTCPALARVARALVQSISTAAPVATSEFEIEGSSELTHCPAGCIARFRARPDEVRIYCGTGSDVDLDPLDEYAELMFGSEFRTLPSSIAANPPCAMLQALTLEPSGAAKPELRASV